MGQNACCVCVCAHFLYEHFIFYCPLWLQCIVEMFSTSVLFQIFFQKSRNVELVVRIIGLNVLRSFGQKLSLALSFKPV